MELRNDQPVTAETILANRRHDAQFHSICMNPAVSLRARNISTGVTGLLTDKKIEAYRAQGYYSAAFREARRELWQRRASRQTERRDGNFLVFKDGRKVFSPL